ncbi:hypothetical protein BT96DRAFT_983491 [Gymnopus androsaceus JB14]|uniref:Uncharacterized protein n=1 Tax=Gymnopus androsaceus JB14 TaxID=1447944 RepID=A0A6A4ISB5_9AGAR|nr:hypothetical protein BT96DRAFT_983491 [Gymnopus androsaceus JB14]
MTDRQIPLLPSPPSELEAQSYHADILSFPVLVARTGTAMSNSSPNFNPLKHREWQCLMDRKYHQGWIASLNRPAPRYREAEDTYRRALDDLRIAVERTDSLYSSLKSSSGFKHYFKYLQYQKSYWEYYKRCFEHVDKKAFTDWIYSRRKCVDEIINTGYEPQYVIMEKERPPRYAP